MGNKRGPCAVQSLNFRLEAVRSNLGGRPGHNCSNQVAWEGVELRMRRIFHAGPVGIDGFALANSRS
jgi:hypothetical protein